VAFVTKALFAHLLIFLFVAEKHQGSVFKTSFAKCDIQWNV